jgi:hypothetical protein
MPSTKQNAEYLRQMKEAGLLTEKISNQVEAAPTPSQPIYPNEPNPRLRTPMAFQTVYQPDLQRQFLNPAIPQVRMLPKTAAFDPVIGAAATSQALIVAANATVAPAVPVFPVAGQFYEINSNGNFETIVSVNGNLVI